MKINVSSFVQPQREYEFIERKGIGHPDTISDRLAEELSSAYSKYTLNNFGMILHHNFDKVGILGGSAKVAFGEGSIKKPIRIMLNGRASTQYGNDIIPVTDILTTAANNVMHELFPMIDIAKDVIFLNNLSTSSSPGNVDTDAAKQGTRKNWFTPQGPQDIQELHFLAANDTSLGAAFAPLSSLENAVLAIENDLTGKFRSEHPWVGTDVKIMAARFKDQVEITLCLPQICTQVRDISEYKRNTEFAKMHLSEMCNKLLPQYSVKLFINMRDKFDTCELYLTFTGSAIENGDEGLVGRGNRTNGIISNTRPFSIEGACGKNPVYHVGKIYNVVAQNIANSVYEKMGEYTEVFLVSQTGQSLAEPWRVNIGTTASLDVKSKKEITEIAKTQLALIPKINSSIIDGKYRLY